MLGDEAHRREEPPIRVAIADDDAVFLDQIGRFLSHRFDVVARAADGGELCREVLRLAPELVVTDITMPRMNGIEAARRITAACPGVKVVVLSIHSDPAYVEAAFGAGAAGYVLKFNTARELICAIDEVLAGRVYRSPEV